MTPTLWRRYLLPFAEEQMDSTKQSGFIQGCVTLCLQRYPCEAVLCVGIGDGLELACFKRAVGIGLFVPPKTPRTARADMHALPFHDGAFEGIFCKDTFEHALAPSIVLDEFVRVARTWIYLGIPGDEWTHSPLHPLNLSPSQIMLMAKKRSWKTDAYSATAIASTATATLKQWTHYHLFLERSTPWQPSLS